MSRRTKDHDSSNSGVDVVVTSAPASAVGSLLTDLLSEAKAEVDAERQALQQQVDSRQLAQDAKRRRHEALERERLQQQLIQETRRRNEALTRKDRAALAAAESRIAEKDASTDLVPANLQERALPLPASINARAKRPAWAWVAAAALVLLAAGGATALAMSQSDGMPVPTVAGVADNAITQAKLGLAKRALKNNRTLAADAAQELKDAKASELAARSLAEKERNLRKKQEAEQLRQSQQALTATPKKGTIRGKKIRGKKKLVIRTDVFGEPSKKKKKR